MSLFIVLLADGILDALLYDAYKSTNSIYPYWAEYHEFSLDPQSSEECLGDFSRNNINPLFFVV